MVKNGWEYYVWGTDENPKNWRQMNIKTKRERELRRIAKIYKVED
jgi:hypothetical protein